jgi:hypothetical protein
LLDHNGVLTLKLVDAQGNAIKVTFDSYLAYRKIDEGDALLTLAEMRNTGGTAKCFYQVQDSAFIAWFNEERCHIDSSDTLIHFSVAASNEIIDVLALQQPVVVED